MMCSPKPRSRTPVFLSRKLPLRDAADVALLTDARLQGVRVDLDVFGGFFDFNGVLRLGGAWLIGVNRLNASANRMARRWQCMK